MSNIKTYRPVAQFVKVLALLVGSLWPATSFALTFNLPAPGIVTMAITNPNTSQASNQLIYRRNSDGRCYFWQLSGGSGSNLVRPREDVIINGSSGGDSFLEYSYNWDTQTYPVFCDVPIVSIRPDSSYRYEVNLGGGDDFAYLNHYVVVHGGDGDDFLQHTGSSEHPYAALYGDAGNDTLYAGYMSGGSGNDTLCSTTANTTDQWAADGGSGTDTYCGGRIYETRRFGLERYRDSAYCPDACEGWLFGW